MVVTIIASPPGAHKRLGQCRAFSNAEPASVESARFFASLRDPIVYRGDIILLQGGEIRSQEVELTKPVEFRDFIKNECTVRELSSGAIRKELCTTGLRADGKEYAFDKGGDIVVYQPENAYRDLGLVVHRAVMKLKYKGETNYLIKGDNNPAPDVYGITQDFAKEDHMKGKVILRVPILGYLKLFLSLQFDEPENCKYVVDQ